MVDDTCLGDAMQLRRWNEIFALFFDPRVPYAFTVGLLASAVAGSSLHAILTAIVGTSLLGQFGLFLAALVMLLISVFTIRRAVLFWAQRAARGKLVVPKNKQAVLRGGLILLVGLSKQGAERSIVDWHIRHGQLRHCWLLISPDVGKAPKLGDLRQYLLDNNVECHLIDIVDAFDPEQVRLATRAALIEAQSLHARGSWPATVDITAGTAAMSVGAAIAALQVGVELAYYPAKYVDGKLVTDSATAPMLIAVVNDEEILQGATHAAA
jgi:hypothetical protein